MSTPLAEQLQTQRRWLEQSRHPGLGSELMRHGVTTIRDISRNGLHLKWAVNHGTMEGPRIVSCGPGISV